MPLKKLVSTPKAPFDRISLHTKFNKGAIAMETVKNLDLVAAQLVQAAFNPTSVGRKTPAEIVKLYFEMLDELKKQNDARAPEPKVRTI